MKNSQESNEAVARELDVISDLMRKWDEENVPERERLQRLKTYIEQSTDAARNPLK